MSNFERQNEMNKCFHYFCKSFDAKKPEIKNKHFYQNFDQNKQLD